jgi:hypothetical protein
VHRDSSRLSRPSECRQLHVQWLYVIGDDRTPSRLTADYISIVALHNFLYVENEKLARAITHSILHQIAQPRHRRTQKNYLQGAVWSIQGKYAVFKFEIFTGTPRSCASHNAPISPPNHSTPAPFDLESIPAGSRGVNFR